MAIKFDYSVCRDGTKQAIEVVIIRFSVSGKNEFSLELPPRYGKSHTARLIALISTEGWIKPDNSVIKPFASANLFLTHVGNLRAQIIKQEKWSDLIERFKITGCRPRYSELKKIPKKYIRGLRPNNEHFLAATIQLVNYNSGIFKEWILYEYQKTGLPVNVFFDEAHFSSISNQWGGTLDYLKRTGAARVITMTATGTRADGDIVPAFEATEREKEEFSEVIFKRSFVDEDDQKEKVELEKQTGQKTIFDVRAHVSVPFRVAWENGYLCLFDRQGIDIDLSKVKGLTVDNIDPGYKLSELSITDAARNLGKIVKSAHCISVTIQFAVERLLKKRKLDPRIAMMIFSEPDETGQKNWHQKQIEKYLNEIAPFLKVAIATGSNDENDADDIIDTFEKSTNDVLLVKSMAGAGFDCSRIKVIVDLSAVRQDASTLQRWTRGCTPHKNIMVCDLIIPDDAKHRDIYERLVENEGGTATRKDIESSETIIVDKKDNNQPYYIVNDAKKGNFSSIGQNIINQPGMELETARMIEEIIPQATAYIPRAELVDNIKKAGATIQVNNMPPESNLTLDQMILVRQDDIINQLESYVRLALNAKVFAYPSFGAYQKICYRELKDRAIRVFPKVGSYRWEGIRNIRDIEILDILKIQAALMLREGQNGDFVRG